MTLPIYQVDAFADAPFEGNPAAVCPLAEWLPDKVLQAIALENNLSETAFFLPRGDAFDLRWFTPKIEVELCGHATLATAHVLFAELGYEEGAIRFDTRSGRLTVRRTQSGDLEMDFPATPVPEVKDAETLAQVAAALGAQPLSWHAGVDGMAVFADAATIAEMAPDMGRIAALPVRGLIVTAPGAPDSGFDFVSRFFAPGVGVAEDPVTGSAHCRLAPYWAARLGKSELRARQMSERGGTVLCRIQGDRVLLGGRAVTFMRGAIDL